ncbi:SDR family NAD(P)-dependent oxidoreductase [Actinotalea ferrariae]|uniref:SDR family NAD(P)-dependent oxidoreductase n=1 Tax=Actinotalea ferrariae TaxID=1386098 RepID=UPI001C8CCD3D|nr:SDR family NAD(P)-dependent oxidoreductase [Actinotalea ferrariae]MBX9245739.1 SDR family NAD(P)-dependent oxidoreductase [Actinotalea ferrariae]
MTDHHATVPAPRTAVVTGAGRGIGRGLATGLAARGVRVALLGRTAAHLEAVADEIRGGVGGPDAVAAVVPVDVTDGTAVRTAAAQVEEAFAGDGGVGLLVNNAGVIERQEVAFADDDLDDVWRVVETNVRGPFLVTHALLPAMLARGSGRIVNLSSGAAYRPSPAYTGYGVSKAALARFTSVLDAQYREAGLRVFDLAPGVVATDMTASMPQWDGRTEWTPVEASVDLLLGVIDGELEAWSGRFVRAGADTVASLVAHADDVVAHDARRLGFAPYGPDDPILP